MFVETIVVVNKIGQDFMFIPIPLFWISRLDTTMHSYTVFTFSIVVYIPTAIFTLKGHPT